MVSSPLPWWRSVWFSRVRLAVLLVLLTLATLRLADPALLPGSDFCDYWCGGRLLITDGNPYSPTEMRQIQRSLGYEERPSMMYNLPWTLPLLAPFALLDFVWARLLWLILSAGMLFTACNLIWKSYGGAIEKQPLAWLIAGLFYPTINVLRMGQIGAFLLLGMVLFLYTVRARRDFWAGVALALLAMKPHLFVPLVVLLLLWVLHSRRWRILLGGALTLTLSLGTVFLLDPQIFTQYQTLMREASPANWYTPTTGNFLRLALGWERTWLQYIPTGVGAAWAVWYWCCHRDGWDWQQRLPLVIAVGIVAAPYGAWTFDLVVLLLPVLACAVPLLVSRWRWFALGLHFTMNALMVLMLEGGIDPMWQVWVAPTILGCYLGFQHLAPAPETCTAAPSTHPT